METKKEDTKDESFSDQTANHFEQRISEIEKKLDELSHSNEKQLLRARLLISEKRVTFLLAILALLGIVYPLYKTELNTGKVDNAIQQMESRFKELAGEYLRKPEIACDISGENLLNNTLAVGCLGDKTSQTFTIKNIGDASAGPTNVYLYVKYKIDSSSLEYFWYPNNHEQCEILSNDNPQYDAKFFVFNIIEFHAGRTFDAWFGHSVKIDSPLEVPAMLKIYYNGPKPIEVPFTMRFIPKESVKTN